MPRLKKKKTGYGLDRKSRKRPVNLFVAELYFINLLLSEWLSCPVCSCRDVSVEKAQGSGLRSSLVIICF